MPCKSNWQICSSVKLLAFGSKLHWLSYLSVGFARHSLLHRLCQLVMQHLFQSRVLAAQSLHLQGTPNQFFFYVEICFWKVTKFSDFFLKINFPKKKYHCVENNDCHTESLCLRKKKVFSHWVTVFKKKNVCHTESLFWRKKRSKTAKNLQKLSKTVHFLPFLIGFKQFLTVFS